MIEQTHTLFGPGDYSERLSVPKRDFSVIKGANVGIDAAGGTIHIMTA